ncbi:hypothetical protein MRX96_017868 [Rhipicephalus microplus]
MSANQPKRARQPNFTKKELAILVDGYEVNPRPLKVEERVPEGPWPNGGTTSRQHYMLSRGSFERPPRFEKNGATSIAPPRRELLQFAGARRQMVADQRTWHLWTNLKPV